FMDHDHNMLMWDSKAAPGLKAQMYAWRNGRNGLAGNGPDNSGVRSDYRHYLDWRASLKPKPPKPGKPPKPKPKPLPVAYIDGIEKSRKYGFKVRPYYSVKLLQRALNRIYA